MLPPTDGKKMLVWVILPPNFDDSKKYPTLLYCQGGPQAALTQFYSFRWNFQLMASERIYRCSTESSRSARTWRRME